MLDAIAKHRAQRFARVCFSAQLSQSKSPSQANELALPPMAAQALADLLPLLLCGEASAELVFSGAAHKWPESADSSFIDALERIADDEHRHALMLASLREQLPPPADHLATQRAARFLRRMESRDLAVHMARVGALDAGVCHVLAAITRPGTPPAQSPQLARLFLLLRRDEGRHVRVSMRCAAALGLESEATNKERRLVWQGLAKLLRPGTAALTILGADVARLFARLDSTTDTLVTRL